MKRLSRISLNYIIFALLISAFLFSGCFIKSEIVIKNNVLSRAWIAPDYETVWSNPLDTVNDLCERYAEYLRNRILNHILLAKSC